MSIISQLGVVGSGDLVSVVRSACERLREVGLVSLSDTALLSHVGDLGAVLAQCQAARLAAVREVDTRGVAVTVAGASSTSNWLRGALRERPGAATRLVAVSRALA